MPEHIFHILDKTPLPGYLFYPRQDYWAGPDNSTDFLVHVSKDIGVHLRLYSSNQNHSPWLLYFHGNGEVVSDYDGIAPFYNRLGINFAVADYRGYGKSAGVPSFFGMINDAGIVMEAFLQEVKQKHGYKKIWVMGRSMGSLPAIYLATNYEKYLEGAIIESGFLNPVRLLRHLGIPDFGVDTELIEEESSHQASKVKIPVLIIHGEHDGLVPLQEAEDLFREIGSADKKMVVIPEADHNDIIFRGQEDYFSAILDFITRFRQSEVSQSG